jgi:hypothetical protein
VPLGCAPPASVFGFARVAAACSGAPHGGLESPRHTSCAARMFTVYARARFAYRRLRFVALRRSQESRDNVDAHTDKAAALEPEFAADGG